MWLQTMLVVVYFLHIVKVLFWCKHYAYLLKFKRVNDIIFALSNSTHDFSDQNLMQTNKDGGQIAEVAAATNMAEGNVTATESQEISHQ